MLDFRQGKNAVCDADNKNYVSFFFAVMPKKLLHTHFDSHARFPLIWVAWQCVLYVVLHETLCDHAHLCVGVPYL